MIYGQKGEFWSKMSQNTAAAAQLHHPKKKIAAKTKSSAS
jgi:hypothetical protein